MCHRSELISSTALKFYLIDFLFLSLRKNFWKVGSYFGHHDNITLHVNKTLLLSIQSDPETSFALFGTPQVGVQKYLAKLDCQEASLVAELHLEEQRALALFYITLEAAAK